MACLLPTNERSNMENVCVMLQTSYEGPEGVQHFKRCNGAEGSPYAAYTHCRSHFIDLAIVAACKNHCITILVDVISSVDFFYEYSQKESGTIKNS